MSFARPTRLRTRRSSLADHLRTLPVFADCSDRELDRVAGLVTEIHVPAGPVLLTEGGSGRQFLVVADGTVSVSRAEQALAVLGAGDFVGELSILGQTTPMATVTALTAATVWVSSPAELVDIFHTAPSVAAKVRAIASDRSAA